jgi:Glycosyl hydrolase family 1
MAVGFKASSKFVENPEWREADMKDEKAPVAESTVKPLTRRTLLQGASAATVVGMVGSKSLSQTAAGDKPTAAASGSADKSKAFPDKFLWGCATAGHQVEGNNTSSDLWLMEHLPGSFFKEPSGDACDHYHLYPQDISMLADLGFNTYRFSLEWSRIEPEEGFFSNAELEHYRRMLATCREHHLTTLLTYSHFSMPRWFAVKGGMAESRGPRPLRALLRKSHPASG